MKPIKQMLAPIKDGRIRIIIRGYAIEGYTSKGNAVAFEGELNPLTNMKELSEIFEKINIGTIKL